MYKFFILLSSTFIETTTWNDLKFQIPFLLNIKIFFPFWYIYFYLPPCPQYLTAFLGVPVHNRANRKTECEIALAGTEEKWKAEERWNGEWRETREDAEADNWHHRLIYPEWCEGEQGLGLSLSLHQ